MPECRLEYIPRRTLAYEAARLDLATRHARKELGDTLAAAAVKWAYRIGWALDRIRHG